LRSFAIGSNQPEAASYSHPVKRGRIYSDLALLKMVDIYVPMISIICVIAAPKSGFWATLLVSPLLIAAGYGLYA
jgi:hypothetical protein